MAQTYATLRLPSELVERIDEYISRNHWGYRSRAELVAEAIRSFLRDEERSRPKELARREP